MDAEQPMINVETQKELITCPLTARELEVVRLLSRGWKNARIAKELGISEDTVKFHTHNIFRKLDVASRTEAALVAIRQGWVEM